MASLTQEFNKERKKERKTGKGHEGSFVGAVCLGDAV